MFLYLSGYDFDQTYVIEDEQPARPSNDNRLRLTSKEHDHLPGFGAASNSDYNVERYNKRIFNSSSHNCTPNEAFTLRLF